MTRSDSRSTLALYAPAMPRSEVITRIATLLVSSRSLRSSWSPPAWLTTAETARARVLAYGVPWIARVRAFAMREAAISSIARNTFFSVWVDLMRFL